MKTKHDVAHSFYPEINCGGYSAVDGTVQFFSIGIGRIQFFRFATTYRGFVPRKTPQIARSILVDKWIRDSEL